MKFSRGLIPLLFLVACAEGGVGDTDAGRRPPDGGIDFDAGDPNMEVDGGNVDAGMDAGPPCEDDDGDGVCNESDACTAGDDGVDGDEDGVPDACDCDASGSVCAPEAACADGADGVECTCEAGYTGDGTTCSPVDCGAPPAPANGTVDAPVTTLGGSATYACNSSFDLVGDAMRTCEADGSWSGSVPLCLLGDCGPLTSPANGSVMAAGTMIGDTATYSCNTGYELIGVASRTCRSDRTWSGSAPTCQRIDCGPLTDPANGSVSAPITTSGATATYSCNFGYLLSGSATRTCQETGAWSGSAPTCNPVNCGPLSSPSNGSVSAPSTTFGATATYSCNSGYTLSGSATRTCLGSGSWSGSAPSCVSSGCGFPGSPLNGSVSAPSTNTGDIASYSCDSGYQILGSTHRVCESSANWSGAEPTCGEQLSCGCGGTYYAGERVVATASSPSGASGVTAGQQGTVIAGNAPPSTLGVLIEWDGWSSGHNGNCGVADCGTCNPSPTTNRWWTACDQVRSARLPCSCAGAYSEGDRVVAIVDSPAGASGISQGATGTVIAGNAPPATLGVLIEWDGWSNGHTGICSNADCGECVEGTTSNRWYVPCDSISVLP